MNRHLVLLPVLVAFLVGAAPATAWTWPVGGPVLQQFQLGDDPYAADQHRGIDVGGASGVPVRAPAAGTVTFAGTVPGGGRTVTIETPDGFAVTVLHLGSTAVARGASVLEGEAVGTLGQSGDIEHAEPYVHLGVRLAADPHGYLDPLALLPPRAESPAAEPASEEPDPEPTGSPASEGVGAPETPGDQVQAPAEATGAEVDPSGTAAEPVGVPASASTAQPVTPAASVVPPPPAAESTPGPEASGEVEPPVPAATGAPAVPDVSSAPPPAEADHEPDAADGSPVAAAAAPQAVDSGAVPAATSADGAWRLRQVGAGPRGRRPTERRVRAEGRPPGPRPAALARLALTRRRTREPGRRGGGRTCRSGWPLAVSAWGDRRGRQCAHERPGRRARAATLRRRRPCAPRAAGPMAPTGPSRTGSAATCVTRTGRPDVRTRQPGPRAHGPGGNPARVARRARSRGMNEMAASNRPRRRGARSPPSARRDGVEAQERRVTRPRTASPAVLPDRG